MPLASPQRILYPARLQPPQDPSSGRNLECASYGTSTYEYKCKLQSTDQDELSAKGFGECAGGGDRKPRYQKSTNQLLFARGTRAGHGRLSSKALCFHRFVFAASRLLFFFVAGDAWDTGSSFCLVRFMPPLLLWCSLLQCLCICRFPAPKSGTEHTGRESPLRLVSCIKNI